MSWETLLDKACAESLPELRILPDEPMSRHTSFHIGGGAKRMAFPDSAGQLTALLRLAADCGARPLIVGNGTNLLVPDEGLDRLVISTSGGGNRSVFSQENHSAADSGNRSDLGGESHSGGLRRLDTGAAALSALAEDGAIPGELARDGVILAEAGCSLRKAAEFACAHALAGMALSAARCA